MFYGQGAKMKYLPVAILVLIVVDGGSATEGSPNLRIYNGEEAVDGQFPYAAQVYKSDWGNMFFVCGGSLINQDWVLTAAHCIYDIETIAKYVRLGALKKSGGISYDIASRIYHEKYNSRTGENDIALLLLSDSVTFTDQIRPIGLPGKELQNELFHGAKGVINGWGSTDDTSRSDVLRFANVNVISNELCKHSGLSLGIYDSTICAQGVNNSAACKGDSGGGLVVESVLIGVTSFGADAGCTKGHPVAFARVTSYLDWITETMAENE